jgi:hypothetical protein
MKNPNQSSRTYISVSILLLIAFVFTGCAALNEAQQRRREKVKQKQKERYLTLERPTAKVQVSPDGLRIESTHYILTFAEDLLKNKDFDEVKERQGMGRGALVFMESFYDFVHDIFGFEPNHRIYVILRQTHRGTTQIATTQVHYDTAYYNGEFLKIIGGIEMNFPIVMFRRIPVRAHELTHAFTDIYLLPIWFAEGVAVLVEVEYAKGTDHRKVDLQETLTADLDGINSVQNWGGHRAIDALTEWRYNYAYSIVSELKQRFGEDFYPRVFRLIEEDRLHQKLPGRMSTSFLVYYLSQAAGQDLVPFFEGLKFQVRSLTRSEIVSAIRQITPNRGRENSKE